MNSNSLDYDHIASDYDQRYPPSQQWERGRALLDLARQLKAGSILETGSGTGFWLTLLSQVTPRVFGLDFSLGMLKQARNRPAPLKLSRGTALRLPYQNESFDLVYCVDAIHHFYTPEELSGVLHLIGFTQVTGKKSIWGGMVGFHSAQKPL